MIQFIGYEYSKTDFGFKLGEPQFTCSTFDEVRKKVASMPIKELTFVAVLDTSSGCVYERGDKDGDELGYRKTIHGDYTSKAYLKAGHGDEEVLWLDSGEMDELRRISPERDIHYISEWIGELKGIWKVRMLPNMHMKYKEYLYDKKRQQGKRGAR